MSMGSLIRAGLARKCSKDAQLFKAILKAAEDDLVFVQSLLVNEISARKVFANYYGVLKSILYALALKDGLKVYSPEAYAPFLKEKGLGAIAEKFERFRKLRDSINFQGKAISIKEAEVYCTDMLGMVKKLKAEIKNTR